MPEIRWLYPTSTATKSHAFLGTTIVRDSELGDDVEQGKQSLCRKYSRYSWDHGWAMPSGAAPKDACAPCARKAAARR